MKTSTPKFYFEPWTAAKSLAWELPFKCGPPKIRETPDELSDAISQWEADKSRAERNAPWIIWGSKLRVPGLSVAIDGTPVAYGNQGIITTVSKHESIDTVSHIDIAKRIAACVNACAGIDDPEKFIKDVRALMLVYLQGDYEEPGRDPRVSSLLARCIPQHRLNTLDFDGDLEL